MITNCSKKSGFLPVNKLRFIKSATIFESSAVSVFNLKRIWHCVNLRDSLLKSFPVPLFKCFVSNCCNSTCCKAQNKVFHEAEWCGESKGRQQDLCFFSEYILTIEVALFLLLQFLVCRRGTGSTETQQRFLRIKNVGKTQNVVAKSLMKKF